MFELFHRFERIACSGAARHHGRLATILFLFSLVGCQAEETALCAGADCPTGSTCETNTGHCKADTTPNDPTGELGIHISLAQTQSRDLFAALYDRSFKALVVRHIQADGTIVDTRIDGAPLRAADVGSYASIALDRYERPQVAYYDQTNGALRLATQENGQWSTPQEIDAPTGVDVGRWASLVVDGTDGQHIAYRDETRRELRILSLGEYGCRPEGASAEAPEPMRVSGQIMSDSGFPSSNFGQYASIAITGDRALMISFYDAERGNLMLARCNGDELTLQVLDGEDPDTGIDTGDVGQWASLAVDADGDASIAYYDRTNQALKYAGSRQGELTIVTVDDGSACGIAEPGAHIVGQRASLAMFEDPQQKAGLPRLAYMDSTARAVRVAQESTLGTWTCQTVHALDESQAMGGVGLGLDLVVDKEGTVNVMYGEWTVINGEIVTSVHRKGLPSEEANATPSR